MGSDKGQESQQDNAVPRDFRMKISESKISENLVQSHNTANSQTAANLGQESVKRGGPSGEVVRLGRWSVWRVGPSGEVVRLKRWSVWGG